MLPPEKEDGNIEYKRYILIKVDKSNDYSDIEIRELMPLLKDKIYSKNDDEIGIKDIEQFHLDLGKKRLRRNLRFNQLASQMRYRLGEGNGNAIYYIGINDDGSIYNLSKIEKTESMSNLKEIVKFINCNIDKVILIDNYIKVIIKDKHFRKLQEKHILLLGDSESGKTTFLSYLIKNKLDSKNSKARLHILNHKHEIETGRTSSFTYKYIDFNETKFVFIDSPGWDGVSSDSNNINMKSSKKRNKLLLSFKFDLVIFFDKNELEWYKKDFYLKYCEFSGIPTLSVNLFDKDCFINLINPIGQEPILSYINSKFKIKNSSSYSLPAIGKVSLEDSKLFDEVDNLLLKMEKILPDPEYSSENNNIKNLVLSTSDYKKRLSSSNLISGKRDYTKYDEKDLDSSRLCNLIFISSYPHQDMGLILSGYLKEGYLKRNQKLYCYIDLKLDFESEYAESNLATMINPIQVEIKSIYKDGNNVDSISSPSTITISIDYKDGNNGNFLNIYGDFSKLLRFKDIQVNFLSNFSYKPETKFKLNWYIYYEKNTSKSIKNTDSLINIQIMVRNQVINLKRIDNYSDEYYIVVDSKKSKYDDKKLYNINNQDFIYDNLDSYGFGIIKSFV